MSRRSGPRRLSALECALLHLVETELWRFGGECICTFQLVGLDVYMHRFGGECVLKWSVVVNLFEGMVVRMQWWLC